MLVNVLILILGLALIMGGANFLTDGASSIARRFGITPMVVGLTVVAFGTSAPELVISCMAAAKGEAGLAIGNVVGSNIFTICAVVGIVALVSPIKVTRTILSNDIPLVILSSVVVLVMGNIVALDGASENVFTRSSGIIMLLFFAIFLRYTLSVAKNSDSDESEAVVPKEVSRAKSILMIVGGLAALLIGGELFVNGASGVARGLNVSDAIIGLTIVAAGTSLPELAASVVAALKGQTAMAIGSVVGSCLFNVFAVLGASAVIAPLPLGGITNVDLLVLLGASILFWIFGQVIRTRIITRAEGAILTAIYIAYTIYLVV